MEKSKRTIWGNRLEWIGLLFILALWPVLSFSPALTQIMFWVSFSFLLLVPIVKNEKLVLPDKWSLILLAIFLIGVVISMTATDYPKQSWRGLLKAFRQIAILFVVFHYFQTSANQSKLRMVIFFSLLLLVADGAYQYFVGTDFLRGFVSQEASRGKRLGASLEHYGKLAGYLCAVLPAVIGITLSAIRKGWRRYQAWLWIALSVAGLALLFFTRSRGAFAAFFLAGFFLLLLKRSWKILGIACVIATIFISILPRSMITQSNRENEEQSVLERVELWHRAVDVIKARPLTGTGINTYAVAHQQFDSRQNWRVKNYYAHNGYLQTAAEIGVPGTLALIMFFLRWLWIHKPSADDQSPGVEERWGFLGGVMAFLIFCLGDTAMHSLQPVMAFWFVLGVFGAMNVRQVK